jgi:hypothetical protein
MSIRKPFCAIGLIFYVLIIAAFSKWQASFDFPPKGGHALRTKGQAEYVTHRQEIQDQRQENGKKLSQG